MINQINWVDRKFQFDLPDEKIMPAEVFPSVMERFRGTPARLEELIDAQIEDTLVIKPDGKWSVKEHVGHLFDLEELGEKRLDDFLSGKEVLSPADMSNRKTDEADHNQQNISDILKRFRNAREHLVYRLKKLTPGEIALKSIHPRLNKSMRIIDWIFFMCEHDDHHLAKIRELLNLYSK